MRNWSATTTTIIHHCHRRHDPYLHAAYASPCSSIYHYLHTRCVHSIIDNYFYLCFTRVVQVPAVHAARKGIQIASVPVKFMASYRMKAQEEGNVSFIEKRIHQLNSYDPVIKAAWTDAFYV